MDLSKFTRDELIMAGVALLLAIDLLFLPWFDISIGAGALPCVVHEQRNRVARRLARRARRCWRRWR